MRRFKQVIKDYRKDWATSKKDMTAVSGMAGGLVGGITGGAIGGLPGTLIGAVVGALGVGAIATEWKTRLKE